MKPEYSVQNYCYKKLVPKSRQTGTMRLFCVAQGCPRRIYARGFCRRHYKMWRTSAPPELSRHVPAGTYSACSVDGCDRPNYAKSVCFKHYQKLRKYGDPTVQLRAPKGSVPIEKRRDYVNGKPRPRVWVDGKCRSRSRWVWEQHHGPIPEGHHIHHINNDPFDDRIENLECVEGGYHITRHWEEWRQARGKGGSR